MTEVSSLIGSVSSPTRHLGAVPGFADTPQAPRTCADRLEILYSSHCAPLHKSGGVTWEMPDRYNPDITIGAPMETAWEQ